MLIFIAFQLIGWIPASGELVCVLILPHSTAMWIHLTDIHIQWAELTQGTWVLGNLSLCLCGSQCESSRSPNMGPFLGVTDLSTALTFSSKLSSFSTSLGQTYIFIRWLTQHLPGTSPFALVGVYSNNILAKFKNSSLSSATLRICTNTLHDNVFLIWKRWVWLTVTRIEYPEWVVFSILIHNWIKLQLEKRMQDWDCCYLFNLVYSKGMLAYLMHYYISIRK